MRETLHKRDQLIYGVLLPVGLMIVGLLVIMNLDSGASAAEFAALGVMLGAIVMGPIVLVVNFVLAFQGGDTSGQCFRRGMISPGVVLVGAFVYQIGLWDAMVEW